MNNILNQKRDTFQTPYSEFEMHRGKSFEIIDYTPAAKRNHPDFTDTYLIRFQDGTEIIALPEEVLNNTGWNPANSTNS